MTLKLKHVIKNCAYRTVYGERDPSGEEIQVLPEGTTKDQD